MSSLPTPPHDRRATIATITTTWQKMHIDPTINLGHIITTIMIVASLLWWGGSVETRLSNHDQKVIALEKMDVAYDKAKEDQRRELREELRDIKQELKELNNRLVTTSRPR